jgi:uncharacterized membrane-anchored protein
MRPHWTDLFLVLGFGVPTASFLGAYFGIGFGWGAIIALVVLSVVFAVWLHAPRRRRRR